MKVLKPSQLTAILTLALLFGGLPIQSQGRAEEIDVFGYYYFKDPVPKALQDISELHLSTSDMRGDQMVKVPLYGFIRFKTKSLPDAYLVKPARTDKAFRFATQVVKGISFQFSGKFLKLGNFPVKRPQDDVILTGRLIRFQNQKKVFDQNVNFMYSAGD